MAQVLHKMVQKKSSIHQLNMNDKTILNILKQRAKANPHFISHLFLDENLKEKKQLSINELNTKAQAIASILQAHHLQGKAVFLFYDQGADYLCALFACFYADVIAVPVYPPMTKEMITSLAHMRSDAFIQLALTKNLIHEKITEFKSLNPTSEVLFHELNFISTDLIPDIKANEYIDYQPRMDNIAYIQYTSGSTSDPKGVMVTHANLMANLKQIAKNGRLSNEDIQLSWLPHYHNMGLVSGYLMPIYVGSKAILTTPVCFLKNPLAWLHIVSDYRATMIGAPDFALRLCASKITKNESELDLSSLKMIFTGSEKNHVDTLQGFYKKFEPYGLKENVFLPCYGLAEAVVFIAGSYQNIHHIFDSFDEEALKKGDAIIVDASDPHAKSLMSVGLPASEMIIKIVDSETKAPLGENKIGEIWVSGPNVSSGYYHHEEQSLEVMHAHLSANDEHRYLRTGDLGFIHQGELYVSGRIKDLIIINGLNHYPHDIELDIEMHCKYLQAGSIVTFSIEQKDTEQLIIVAEIDKTNRSQEKFKLIAQKIVEIVSAHHRVKVSEVILIEPNTIPKTMNGKLRRHAYKLQYLNKTLQTVFQETW